MPGLSLRMSCIAAAVATSMMCVGSAHAHVGLLSPNGGEELEIGSTFEIRWTVLIEHDLQNWDLWYSTTSDAGPWTAIEMDLAAGSGAVGSMHTYDWTVPADASKAAWVRVRMDNNGTNYFDVSDAPFVIDSTCHGDLVADGEVGFEDLLLLLFSWGPCPECPADLDADQVVGFRDLLDLLFAWGPCS